MPRQNLRDVHYADWFLLAADQAFQVHQAAHVVGGQHLSAGLLVVVRCGRRPIMQETASSFTANVPPKPQHSSGRCELDQFDPVEHFQQRAGFVERLADQLAVAAQPQFAQAVAALMQADAVGKLAVELFRV